ncbi:MAG: hypothetical protein ACYSYV_11715 [Planctomycetota bacterium]
MKMKKAVAGTTAKYDKRQHQTYPKTDSLSSRKAFIGELLLFGNGRRKVFWPFFDATLRQYTDLRLAFQDASETPERTDAKRPD